MRHSGGRVKKTASRTSRREGEKNGPNGKKTRNVTGNKFVGGRVPKAAPVGDLNGGNSREEKHYLKKNQHEGNRLVGNTQVDAVGKLVVLAQRTKSKKGEWVERKERYSREDTSDFRHGQKRGDGFIISPGMLIWTGRGT